MFHSARNSSECHVTAFRPTNVAHCGQPYDKVSLKIVEFLAQDF